jgi:hypothetical protein
MACYFKVCQIVPLYLNANTIVIDEITHSIRIIGGWWSWAKFGEPVLKMPYETVKMMTEAGEADPIARLFPLDTEKSGCYVMLRQIKSLCLEIYQRGTFILELGWDLYRWLCKVPEKTCLRELSSFYKVFAGVLDKDDEADIKLVLARFRAGPKAK